MATLVLVALLALAFTLQYRLDARNIARLAEERRWTTPRITWTPGSLLSSRWERTYWLRYLGADGRPERRRCRVTSWFAGPAGVHLEPAASDPPPRTSRSPRTGTRVGTVVLAAGIGAFVGVALGIGASFGLYPGSNIAPAYGVLFGAPLGLVAGALLGACRRTR